MKKYILYSVILHMLFLTLSYCAVANDIIKRKITMEYTCAERNFAVSDLNNRLELTRTAFAVTSNNSVIEIYTNKYRGNWLIMVTGTDKVTCGLMGGQQEFIFE
tara:strand:+ start:478 stop:789 length:312 start_codon:yes stop_codon:yes gene_type:complete